MNTEQKNLFKNGSTTYFTSSLFFPKNIRNDVTRLYAFVRKADDLVDATPQKIEEYENFMQRYEIAFDRKKKNKNDWQSGDFVIDDYISLAIERQFNPSWTKAFLEAMHADITKKTYKTLEETESYMYGSAEVVGLFMCKLLDLPEASYRAAQSLGKAMQFINFVRDIQEDISLGRQYIPQDEVKRVGLEELSQNAALAHPEAFKMLVNNQIAYFIQWQSIAEQGYHFIPKRYRIAIKTAGDMYKWTAMKISQNPMVIFEKKVKPPKWYILIQALLNLLSV